MLGGMALRVIQGPPNSGRAGEILAAFRASLEREPVLVVPTGDDVATFERELCGGSGATLGGSISTFAGLNLDVARTLAVELAPTLTVAQRQALLRAAIRAAEPKRLRRSASRPGFAPALDRLVAELQAALISPAELRTLVGELEDPGYESELCDLYTAYVDLREASGRGDAGTIAAAAIAALRADPEAWGGRPVFVYGFDDLTRAQLELVDALARAGEATVAVNYADRRALAVRAHLIGVLTEELGADEVREVPFDEAYTDSATLRHLDRSLFEPDTTTVDADGGLTLLESAGPRGEAEAIGVEIARLLAQGLTPDEIAIVLRHPESSGPLVASVLRDLGIPVALEASKSLAATAVGTSLIALCRAFADERDTGALLTHLRCDPSIAPGVVDGVERRIRRGEAQTVADAVASWEKPPLHLRRLREAPGAAERLRALARSARELAELAHRERAPLAERSANDAEPPFSALELRAGVAAAELLEELAGIGALPGCEQPDVREAVEAIESASVPFWRGPAEGRIRIMSPYRARAARARALFCASLHDGEFPSTIAPDPLLAEERRREIGNPDLRRTEPAEEERYLFHSCVSRPTDRLYLSWQACDEDGTAIARSPFVDDVLDLIAPDPETAEQQLVTRRGPERTVLSASEAPTSRALARALALGGWSIDRPETLERLGVGGDEAAATLSHFDRVPDPTVRPGPLTAPAVLEDLGARDTFSANSLEGWVTCSYKWFVDHELSPQRLEPESDPLWLGSIIHDSLERLYREPPGAEAIPRPGDLDRWRERFRELLEEIATERAAAPLNPARRTALNRARIQAEAFLAVEAESDSDFRPDPELLEVSFGPFEDENGEPIESHPALALGDGEVFLRGRIDRIDRGSDGRSAIVRDYKTGKSVASADKFTDKGTLQIQLYMRAVREVLGLEPVGGLYQPLGATRPDDRRPRGIVRAEDERTKELGIVRSDRRDGDAFEHALAAAEETALGAARAMRAGEIDRDPLCGQCPKYCTYQPICRLERALGAVGDENGNGRSEK